MPRPSDFIFSTDFATLQNDASTELSFIVPGSIVVPLNGQYIASYTMQVGTAGAPARTLFNSSQNPSLWFFGPSIQIVADGNNSVLGAAAYNYFVYITRNSPDTVTATVLIPNTSFGTGILTTEPTPRTIRVKIATFIPPFE